MNEINRFKHSLTNMAQSLVIHELLHQLQNMGILFFEEVHMPHGKQHCVVECVMVPKEVEMDAPIYFRKGMLEVDD